MDRQGDQRGAPRPGGGETAGGSADPGKFHDRLDEIAARLDRLARRAHAPGPAPADHDVPRGAPASARRPRRLPRRAPARGPAHADHAVPRGAPESAVRRREPRRDEPIADASTSEPRREPARPAAAAGPSFSLDDAIAEISARQEALDAEPPAPPARAVDLAGVERLLHNITDQIETLRQPNAMEESIEALRRELADVGRAAAA